MRSRIRPDGTHRTTDPPPPVRRLDYQPPIVRRNGYVIFSAVKPPMQVMFWNIQSMDQLKRTLLRFLEGEWSQGEQIRSIKRLRTRGGVFLERQRWWETMEDDIQCTLMMEDREDIVLTVVIS